MSSKNLYLELVKASEMQFGKNRNPEKIVQALQQTIAEEDLRVYFLLPMVGGIPLGKVHEKGKRLKLTRDQVDQALVRLYRDAFVMRMQHADGIYYERCPLTMTAEQQVRMRKGTPLGSLYAEYWRDIAVKTIRVLPTKTPYLRVIPVQPTIKSSARTVSVDMNMEIPDPRQVTPLDFAEDIVRDQRLIGVADCYCRLVEDFEGNHCDKPRETCFVFNEFAQSLIDLGIARKMTLDEALVRLRECEQAGLIHNLDNYQGQIRSMCNCCACHCPGIQAAARGQKNIQAVSHFYPRFEQTRCTGDLLCVQACPVSAITEKDGMPVTDYALCFGCGQCVSVCPSHARSMVARKNPPKVFPTFKILFGQQVREAAVGIVINKITGKGA
jgi:Pyruvate/2-oxoacid:ferredoxin oxidoreductase delta subunit